jgi:hypothetical protein
MPPECIVCGCVVPVVSKKEYKGNAFAILQGQCEKLHMIKNYCARELKMRGHVFHPLWQKKCKVTG